MDGLATCAGIVDRTPFMEATSETFARVYAVNVTGTFLCMREAARHMAPGGRICAVASISGLRGGGFLGTVAYSSSKGAVFALAKTAARNLAAQGISVNTVTPGSTLTSMTREGLEDEATRDRINAMSLLNRLGEPGEIAEAIGWMLSPRASFVNGANLVVDGGLVLQ
jgi:NAD(P)-dependent dehydrogenase (short-subunit alcohol dehydrogenase family)